MTEHQTPQVGEMTNGQYLGDPCHILVPSDGQMEGSQGLPVFVDIGSLSECQVGITGHQKLMQKRGEHLSLP